MMRGPKLQLEAQKLFAEFSEAALLVNPIDLKIVAANPVCEPTTGYCVDELLGRSLGLLFSDDTREGVSAGALVGERGLHEEISLQRKDGSHFIAAIQVTRIEDREQPLALLFLRDTSARRKLERELITKHLALKEAYEELDRRSSELARANEEIRTAQRWLVQLEKMATVGRFAAGIAHEVNNPMAFILENLHRLQDYAGHLLPVVRSHVELAGPRLQTILDETLEGAQRVSSIVRQLHSFSNVRDLEAEWVDLREVAESAIMMVKNQVRQRARLDRHYFDIPRVACVAGQIGQVLVNVLVNAIHAISEGDVERNQILVQTQPLGAEHVVVQVRDSGCGIPPEHLDRIMEPFFTTKGAGQGTGLGLAISANIVEQHGGRIEVESKVGSGTAVRVILPVQGKLRVPVRASPAAAPASSSRLRLLLVDDEVYLLRALKRNLARDHEVLIASSGQQALELLDAQPAVDLVLADMMMPDMDGVHLYEQLVVRHPHLKQRVVMMSGGVFTERAHSFLARTNLQVLSKPIQREALQQIIAGCTPGASESCRGVAQVGRSGEAAATDKKRPPP